MIEECKNYFDREIMVEGTNLGQVLSNGFKALSEHTYTYQTKDALKTLELTPERMDCLHDLENFVEYIYGQQTEVTPMKVDENGKVEIGEGKIFHRAKATNLERMEDFAVGGILPTEWFGILESEWEARFCTFLSYTRDYEYRPTNQLHKNMRTPYEWGQIVFYIDETNPITKMLTDLDYFTYAYKKEKGEDLSMYPPKVRELMDNLIYPLSPCGRNTHENENWHYHEWLAIPGGVPSFLINGISIHSQNEGLVENLDKIQELFPQATIFNENNMVYTLNNSKQETKEVEMQR